MITGKAWRSPCVIRDVAALYSLKYAQHPKNSKATPERIPKALSRKQGRGFAVYKVDEGFGGEGEGERFQKQKAQNAREKISN